MWEDNDGENRTKEMPLKLGTEVVVKRQKRERKKRFSNGSYAVYNAFLLNTSHVERVSDRRSGTQTRSNGGGVLRGVEPGLTTSQTQVIKTLYPLGEEQQHWISTEEHGGY